MHAELLYGSAESVGLQQNKAADLCDHHSRGKLDFAVRRQNAGNRRDERGTDGGQQLQRELAGFLHLRCIGENFHPLVDRINAGRNQRTGALHFYNAHTASANFVDILQEAQCGDVDARIPCSLQNRRILRHREGHAVDFYIDHIH